MSFQIQMLLTALFNAVYNKWGLKLSSFEKDTKASLKYHLNPYESWTYNLKVLFIWTLNIAIHFTYAFMCITSILNKTLAHVQCPDDLPSKKNDNKYVSRVFSRYLVSSSDHFMRHGNEINICFFVRCETYVNFHHSTAQGIFWIRLRK